jgi:hypothetical protein
MSAAVGAVPQNRSLTGTSQRLPVSQIVLDRFASFENGFGTDPHTFITAMLT